MNHYTRWPRSWRPVQSGDPGVFSTPVCGGQAKTVALTACMRTLLIILNTLRKHRTRMGGASQARLGGQGRSRRHPPGGEGSGGLAIVRSYAKSVRNMCDAS